MDKEKPGEITIYGTLKENAADYFKDCKFANEHYQADVMRFIRENQGKRVTITHLAIHELSGTVSVLATYNKDKDGSPIPVQYQMPLEAFTEVCG